VNMCVCVFDVSGIFKGEGEERGRSLLGRGGGGLRGEAPWFKGLSPLGGLRGEAPCPCCGLYHLHNAIQIHLNVAIVPRASLVLLFQDAFLKR
jgi:hypothetical protein